MTKCIAIIPSRYKSVRLPGKALLEIGGKSLIQRVYERVSQCKEIDRIIIATDDKRIMEHVQTFGAEVQMTFRSHKTGTERCAEVAQAFWTDTIIINIQGDEPFIEPQLIDAIAKKMKGDDWLHLLTARTRIKSQSELNDPATVKVITDKMNRALYFSRLALPFIRDEESHTTEFFKHIGIYAYRNKTLQEISALKSSPLEEAEQLEQLRWIEHGYSIHVLNSNYESFGIDTPDDLERARKLC